MSSDSAEESQPSVTSNSNAQDINMLNVYKLIYTVADKYNDGVLPQKAPYIDEARTEKLGEPFINDEYWAYAEWENTKFQMAKAVIDDWLTTLPELTSDDFRVLRKFVEKTNDRIQNTKTYLQLAHEIVRATLYFANFKNVLQDQIARDRLLFT